MAALSALLALAAAAPRGAGTTTTPSAAATPNMNGAYTYWKTNGAPADKAFPTNLMSYPGGVESFDAYHGPINSTYSMVWWTTASDPLPQPIVARFKGKVMAIVGVEMDQVRKGAGPNGEDVSVPINMAYNHHHNTLITGSGSTMQVVSRHDPRVASGPRRHARMSDPESVWLPVEHTPSKHGVPTSAMFDDGNGGEYRKTLHVYGPPFAQLVDSPNVINGIAMQIDTWHREKMNLTGSPFVPGPVPRRALAPLAGPDAIYSGLLECPLTSRIQKNFGEGSAGFNDSFAAQAFSSCPSGAPSGKPAGAAFCVKQGVNGISGAVKQPGAGSPGLAYAGKLPSAAACEAACLNSTSCTVFTWVSPAFKGGWQNMCYLRSSGTASSAAETGIVTGWKTGVVGAPAICDAPATVPQCKYTVADAAACIAAAKALPGIASLGKLTTHQVDSSTLPPGCSVAASGQVVFNSNASSTACCGVGPTTDLMGTQTLNGNVTLGLAVTGSNSTTTITLTGPADVWFGVGFSAELMADQPWTVIVEGTKVSERKLAKHMPGALLAPSVAVLSNTVVGGVRTVVLARALKGATASHFTFDPTSLSLNFIAAVGTTAAFGPHNTAPHGAETLHLWPTSSPVCVCSIPAKPFGAAAGAIRYLPTGESVGWAGNRCDEQPREDLIAQRNPTCDLRTYVGGLNVCRHGWHLLDADQEVPWMDQPLVYYKKFRVYFQEWKPRVHKQIQRVDWCIASHDGCEYEVPQCAPGTPVENCTHTITGTWAPVPKVGGEDVYLSAIHHHCHAPTCLYVETWNNDTGELLCRTEPVYGGTSGFVSDLKRFDEPGYIANPPCMWGRPEDGLEAPPKMNGVTIFVKAVTNSTYGHHGEMAISQAMLHYGSMNASA